MNAKNELQGIGEIYLDSVKLQIWRCLAMMAFMDSGSNDSWLSTID